MSLIHNFVREALARRPSISVVGDAMIDQYHSVIVDRISPEFAVPVMKSGDERPDQSLPGGAANVCHQMSRLNVDCRLAGFLDATSIAAFEIEPHLCLAPRGARVPLKKRYYHGEQPFCRIDIEREDYGLGAEALASAQASLYDRYVDSGVADDAIILSDYNKGVFKGLDARRRWISIGVPTIVDPKAHPVAGWKGCTIFKPNSEEAARLSGLKDPREQVEYFRDLLECDHVIITRGGEGVNGWDGRERRHFEYRNDRRLAPRSVIGAGDCFAAFLAVSYSLGFPVEQCAEIAFKSGIAYVRNMHNHPISLYDLMVSEDPVAAKYMEPPAVGGKLVFANGCYDLIHEGHLALIRFARSQGDRLIVALNSDASVRRLKGGSRPILPLAERMAMVAAIEGVDFVTSFDEDTPRECIRRLRPSILVKGADYSVDQVIGAELVEEVRLCPLLGGRSTSSIVDKIIASASGCTG